MSKYLSRHTNLKPKPGIVNPRNCPTCKIHKPGATGNIFSFVDTPECPVLWLMAKMYELKVCKLASDIKYRAIGIKYYVDELIQNDLAKKYGCEETNKLKRTLKEANKIVEPWHYGKEC